MIFWILTGSCITVYCAVLPFNNIASGFIVEKWLIPYNSTTHSYTPESDLVRSTARHSFVASFSCSCERKFDSRTVL